MNIKELLKTEIPFPTNAIKKPFVWLFNSKRYISFNLFSLIGWIDVILFALLIINIDNLGLMAHVVGTIYLVISRGIVLLILLLFLIEKIKKFKIKQNVFMDNIFFNIIFCLGLIPFSILSLFVLFFTLALIIPVS